MDAPEPIDPDSEKGRRVARALTALLDDVAHRLAREAAQEEAPAA